MVLAWTTKQKYRKTSDTMGILPAEIRIGDIPGAHRNYELSLVPRSTSSSFSPRVLADLSSFLTFDFNLT